MKTTTLRIAIIVIIVIAGIFAAIIGMALIVDSFSPPWIYVAIRLNLAIIIVSLLLLFVIGSDRDFWKTREQLEKELEDYRLQRAAYKKATVEMQRLQLRYSYDQDK